MGKKIFIRAASVQVKAELNDTKTAEAIWQALPIKGVTNTWGDEIYFPIPLNLELEKGQELMDIGDLAYWPPGNAFCIFFGLTPMSRWGEIVAASPVTVFGRVTGDVALFKQITAGTEIIIEREEQ